MRHYLLGILLCSSSLLLHSQTWVDSLDAYAREAYRPADKYHWNWMNAALLNVMVKRYDWGDSTEKEIYLTYVKQAMDHSYRHARGNTPNGVASALGMAFLYRATKEEKYLRKALAIYEGYQKIKRSPEGGVSHLRLFYELWDDTVFMIGEFLLQMYQATGDEKYLDEFMKQFRIHREKLRDTSTNLWVHGWDADNNGHCTFCSQNGWQNHPDRRSKEYWGRGNGWVIVTLSDALSIVPKEHLYWKELGGYLSEMVSALPTLQDTVTGHWYQLPYRKGEEGNYIESSCTAMFAYGILTALEYQLVMGTDYKKCAELAYTGLRIHSIVPLEKGYFTTQNVCKGTCIGDKHYYFKRKSQMGKPYALGMFIAFGRKYEMNKSGIAGQGH
ncbi:MAG: glycoside hydrolase family 88 protein [Chitinophagales bacterium]|nr:glycoside hydrolase family 88 protein [Chitinophagales bacterium]